MTLMRNVDRCVARLRRHILPVHETGEQVSMQTGETLGKENQTHSNSIDHNNAKACSVGYIELHEIGSGTPRCQLLIISKSVTKCVGHHHGCPP